MCSTSQINKYSETPLIRTLIGLENSVLNEGVSLIEGFILTDRFYSSY